MITNYMKDRSTYKYEISDNDGTEGMTTIRVVNDGKSIYIEICRVRTTTSCTGIKIEDRSVIDMIQAEMNERPGDSV